jgi:hypothetical protein
MKTPQPKDWQEFEDLINNWRTFGAEEDPENFEPYISFDRHHRPT